MSTSAPIPILEHDPQIFRRVSEVLGSAAYSVYRADNAHQLVGLLTQDDYPLVILDVRFPGLDPVAVIRHIRQHFPSTVVCAIGSGLTQQMAAHLYHAGAAQVFPVPFDGNAFRAAIEDGIRSAAELKMSAALSMHSESTQPRVGVGELDSSQYPQARVLPGLSPIQESIPIRGISDPSIEVATGAPPPPVPSLGPPIAGPAAGFPSEFPSDPTPMPSMATPARATLDPAGKSAFLEFLERTLNLFVEIEQENLELTRRIDELQNPSGKSTGRALVTWLAHTDDKFTQGMKQIATRVELELYPGYATGGEIMDKLSTEQPDLIVLGDMLHDMPARFVVETIKSQHPKVVCVVIEGWGGAQMESTIIGPAGTDPISDVIKNVDDLIEVMERARVRRQDADLGAKFAETFRERHSGFLQRYAEIRAVLQR